jgi:hypothetical protein
VNGIQVSFADSQTNSLINRVLSANGLSNVIPTSSRKVERWDTWTLSWAMRLSIPILRDLRLNSVLFAPAPLLLPITTLAFVQVSQRSTLRLE